MNKRSKVAVLFGGCSTEYGVSLKSAHAVLSSMDADRYEPIMVGITRSGDWFLYTGDMDKIAADAWHGTADCIPVAVSPSRSVHGLLVLQAHGVRPLPVDAAFPILHGKNGEDGTVQGLLALAGIPIVGCGVLASAIGMDKVRAHALAHAAGAEIPASFVLERNADMAKAEACAAQLGYPLFVKPVRSGSSYGISRVTEPPQLTPAIEAAFAHDDRVILEEAVSGFEVGCAVMGNGTLTVGEVDEIELSGGFFDFTEKYTLKTSAIHVPARIPPETAEAVKETAKTIYRALDCRGFARVDMFLTAEGRIVFNEINTIPGFTAHSRYPGMMRAAGLDFKALITQLIEQAVAG